MLPTALREIMSMVIIFVITMVTRYVEMATLIQKVIVLKKLVKKSDKLSVFNFIFPLQLHVSAILQLQLLGTLYVRLDICVY